MKWLAFGPALAWGAFVLWLGSRSWDSGLRDWPLEWQPGDKLLHFGVYGVLGALLAWGWRRARRRPAASWLIAGGILLGAVDEWQQRFVPGRSSDIMDWLVDALAVSGIFLVFRLASREARNPTESRSS